MNILSREKIIHEKTIDYEYIRSILPLRGEFSHKGNFGKVLIAAGSEGMCGAAILSSRAAMKSGAGLVKVAVPQDLFQIIQIASPEAICIHRNPNKINFSEFTGIAIGPGMGNNEETYCFVLSVLEKYNGIVVIDADGLNAIAKKSACEMISDSKASVIITPHPVEAARLLGIQPVDFLKIPRPEAADMLAQKTDSVVVLKGSGTVVRDSKGRVFVNKTGNPGMATAGSGDVLTGIITALAGQRIDSFDAAAVGVFIHGMAGDMAASELGQVGMTASDIANYIPYAFKKILAMNP